MTPMTSSSNAHEVEQFSAAMPYMGTFEEAETRFLAAVDKWTDLRQPLIAGAREHKKRELAEREAQFRLANDAALYAWHIRARLALRTGGVDNG